MSISNNVEMGDGIYVPFFQKVRGGERGTSPVGTVKAAVTDTGDMSGGTVTIGLVMRKLTFGFRALIVPTFICAIDNLAAAEAVRLVFSEGNRRIGDAAVLEEGLLSVAVSGQNVAKFDPAGILWEKLDEGAATVVQAIWSTNTNTIVYNLRIVAAVFDAEVIEKKGSISDFLAGVR